MPVLCLCTTLIRAQVPTLADTLSAISPDFYKQLLSERNKRQKSDSLYLYTYKSEQLAFMQSNLTQLIADTIRQAALLRLYYSTHRRDFRLPATAYKTQNAVLYTEGFTMIGKAKIMGKFYFDKIWEDSLANNLSGNLQNGTPFTYFATKAGKFERQNLNFEAGGTYPILKTLYFTSLLHYNYHWSTGSVDPRPDIRLFQIAYSPGLSWKRGNSVLGASYKTGKSDGSYSIVYKNKMFSQSQLYPDRRLYINNGYGYIAQYTAAAFTQSEEKINGWELSASTRIGNWNGKATYNNTFFANSNFNLTTNTDSVNNPIKQSIHSRYERTTQKLDALIFNENAKRVHQLGFNGIINEGTGQLMSSPGGANYLFDEHNATFNYLLSLKKSATLFAELGLNGGVRHFTKKDYLAMHFYENTRAEVSLQAARYLYQQKQQLKITVAPGLVLPIKNHLSVPPTQVNEFTRKIAYSAYYFYGTTLFSGQLGMVYYCPALLHMAGSSFNLDLRYLQKLRNSDAHIFGYEAPGNSKNQLNISLGFQIFL